jgi:diguanylate cyclase (GGDEF)-like protein/PAS domain S-box-containing protein
VIRRFLSWPIRGHLLLLILLLALPVAGIIVYSGIKHRQEGLDEATEKLRRVAFAVAMENRNLVAGVEQILGTLADVPEIRSRNAPAADTLLRNVLRKNPQYANIAVTDTAGAVWASAIAPKMRPFSLADRRMFRNAIATGRFSSGEFAIGRMTGKPILNFGYPIRDVAGRITGVIALALDLDFTKNDLDQKSLLGNAGYLLIDHQGAIVRKGMNARFVGSVDKKELFESMEKGGDEGVFRGVGTDGNPRLFAYRKIRLPNEKTPYLYARSSITIEAAQARADQALIKNLAALAPFPLLAFLVTWFIGKRTIVDRLASLRSAARRLAAGDLHARVDEGAAGEELEELGRTFNEMVENLHDRDRALRKNRNQLRAILDTSQSGIFMTDPGDEYIVFANNRMAEMFGCSMLDLIGTSYLDFVDSGEAPLFQDGEEETGGGDDPLPHAEHRFIRRDGSLFWGYVSAKRCDDEDGSHQGIVFTVTDVTERRIAEDALRKSETRLRYLSTHDSLTELYNRSYFEAEFERAVRGRNYPISIIIADVDDLKRVNDTRGHAEGDRLIAAAAALLRETFRVEDMVARIGGDEFAVLLPGVDEEAMRAKIEAVCSARERYNGGFAGREVKISIGGATARTPDEIDLLFHRADAGMYREKASRKGTGPDHSYATGEMGSVPA